jgi:glutamate:GABA antiporter
LLLAARTSFVFPALVVLRRKYPDAPRPYLVPGGMAGAWIAAGITELFVLVTAVTLLWPGAINALLGESYSVNRNWGVSRAFFESVTLGVFAAMIVLGLLFWAVGTANRRRGITGEAEFVATGARQRADTPS